MPADTTIPYPDIMTPAVLIDLNKLEANIKEMSQLAAGAKVRLRAHVKVHMCAEIAKMQIKAGACGIELGTVGGAAAMAAEGINDILISHPWLYRGQTSELLKKLLRQPELRIGVVVDMLEQAKVISDAGQELGKKVPLMLKINVNAVINGFSRFGVPPGEPSLKLARKISQLPGIDFKGIYAHEMAMDVTPAGLDKAAFETATLMTQTAKLLRKEGVPVEHVSMGSSGTMRPVCRYLRDGKFPEITELHPGNFAIGDLIYMAEGGNTREMCAATILATVISTADTKKAIIDAGFKTFGGDYNVMATKDPGYFWNGLPNFGSVQGRPDLRCGFLAAETGLVFYTDPKKKLNFGERIEIVPNNATLAISMHDQVYGVRNEAVEKIFTVTGRQAGF